jgi:Mut7-C RNAse domain
VHILLTHGVVLDPIKFLTRCVVCNGDIFAVDDPLLKRQIFENQQAPAHESHDLEVHQCNKCLQGYWWSDRPGSSASRVGDQATRLFELCLRAQIPVAQKTEEGHMFEHVDIEKQRKAGWDWTTEGSELLKVKLQVSEWLKDENLKCPVSPLQSAY